EGDSYPVIVTTEKSDEIVFEKKRIVMMLAKEEDAESRHQHSRVIERQDLFDSLKKCRLKLAREANVPAYIIFNDSTLQAMCTALPATRAAFLEIPGVGTVKAEKYGNVFIECIRQYMAETAKSGESSAAWQ
ncbi:MAG: HRDC domain-containing protein, partial [Spirochaetaceae bacterium]|nr:HRDC domain-containing protein [Spirochaetaceae bacterium]